MKSFFLNIFCPVASVTNYILSLFWLEGFGDARAFTAKVNSFLKELAPSYSGIGVFSSVCILSGLSSEFIGSILITD